MSTVSDKLFTIFIKEGNHVFPTVFVLMTRKTTELYTAIFRAIRDFLPDFEPQTSMSDYEAASSNAVQQVFEGIEIKGCWFHFAQAILKKVRNIGLATKYDEDTVKKKVRCVMALPLLPSSEIEEGLHDIEKQLSANDIQLKKLCKYVRRQWITKTNIDTERMSVYGCSERTKQCC